MDTLKACMYWKWTGVFGKIQPFVVIGACFLVNITVGSLYAIGNMIPYVVSYIRARSLPHDLRLNTVTYIYAAQAVGVGMAMFIGGLLDRFIGPRLVVLLGGLIMTTGALLSYVTIQVSFWWFLLTYGLVTGIGLGTLYISPITCSIRWLPNWKGLVSGFVLSGIALGTLICSIAQTGYINPRNLRPENSTKEYPQEKYFGQNEVLDNVPFFFVILGISYAVITAIGSTVLVNPSVPEPKGQNIAKLSTSESDRLVLDSHPKAQVQIASLPLPDSLTPFEALKKPNFYIFAFLLTIGQALSSFINPLYKSFGLQEIVSNDHFLTLVVILGAVLNLLGRVFWPFVADMTSFKTSLVIQGCFVTVFLSTFYITVNVGKYMYLFWVLFLLFGIGGYVSLFPGAVVKTFGPKNMSIIYGMIASFALTTGSLLAGCLSQVLVNTINWYGTFFALAGMSCVYFIVSLLYRHKSYIAPTTSSIA